MKPYLSIITTTRNDSENGDANSRLKLFIDSLGSQAKIHGLNCELIIVEWNPPQERTRLAEILRGTLWSDVCKLKIIEVPPEIHHGIENSEVIPLFQMIAKNAGIRRAEGKFVLATNIDILFSNELIKFLASEDLYTDRMYRIDRYDVPSDIPEFPSVNERLRWCHENTLYLYRYLETVNLKAEVNPSLQPAKPILHKTIFDRLMHIEEPLHTNACGDFTLLSAAFWERVRGYPEFPLRAMKLDGLLCYAAHYAGARELVLEDPMRIYHRDHPARSDGALLALSERETGNPGLQVSYAQYEAWLKQMRLFHKPIIFNNKDWGLADITLPTTLFE
jgi:hypothetical protein